MKLTTLILLFCCMHISAAVFSQQITLSEKDASLETLFSKIEQQTKYNFFYTSEALKTMPRITISVRNATVEQVLDNCFKNLPLSYSIVKDIIVIKPKANLIIPDDPLPHLMVGRVTDKTGSPLPGVTLKIKGTPQVTTTDGDGRFKLLVFKYDQAILLCSFVGYTTLEIKASTLKNPFTIKMDEDISRLDELKVVAYGTTTKRLSTGDQTSITAKDISQYPTNNVLDVLQGSVPGLNIYKNTGNPGSTYKVQLRGINGTTGRQPLYIVDGIPFEGGGYPTQNLTLGANTPNSAAGQGNDALSFINPQDIESITVLKDANATAIYGTRAADGVIIITTKKGRQGTGSPRVEVTFYTGYTAVNHFPDMMNLQQYLQMRKEAKRNDNTSINANDYDINGAWDTTRYTNWPKILLGGMGHLTNTQAAVSGGTKNSQYRISSGYNRQTSITDLNGSNQSASVNFSLGTQSDDGKFSIQMNGGYFYNLNTAGQSDLTFDALLAPDAPPLYIADGSLNFENNTFKNPYRAKNLINHSVGTNLTSSAVISYQPVAGLEFKATLGYNTQQMDEFLGTPATALPPFTGDMPFSTFSKNNTSWWSIEPQANFNRDIGKGKISLTVGGSLQKKLFESTQLKGSGYSSDLLLGSISAATSITNITPYVNEPYKLSGIFGRANYTWDKKYVLDVSGRYDGSSHFGENHQFHLFGAAGAAWIFSEENLIKNNLSFLSFGKLRASYGVTGRDNISAFQYLDTYSAVTRTYQGIGGLIPTGLPNPNLSWESTTKAEISTELQFLKSRISFELNLYRDRTSNVLVNSILSRVTGFPSIVQNLPALTQNQGFDVNLTTYNIRKKDLTWSTTFLLSRNRNKLLSYPNLDQSPYAAQYIIGMPVNIQHVYSFAGVNPQTGVYQFYSKSGAIVSTPVNGTDNFKIIDTNPDYYGSVRNSISYKQFTLDFLFRFIKQIGKNAFGQQQVGPPGLSPNMNFNTLFLNRWQKPGDITDVQRYSTNLALYFAHSDATMSDHGYGDASYIRLQNLSLAYALPTSLLKKLHIQNLQVYIQGDNVLTISKYGAIDPENQSPMTLPPLRTLTSGLRLSF